MDQYILTNSDAFIVGIIEIKKQTFLFVVQDQPVEIDRRFDTVTAVAKGFLTRQLMATVRVQEVVKTIKVSTFCHFFSHFKRVPGVSLFDFINQ